MGNKIKKKRMEDFKRRKKTSKFDWGCKRKIRVQKKNLGKGDYLLRSKTFCQALSGKTGVEKKRRGAKSLHREGFKSRKYIECCPSF